MRNISFIKKVKLFLQYKRTIKKIEDELFAQFNIKVDKATRLYTVMNIPAEIVEEPYNLRKGDIDAIANAYIKTYTGKLSEYLNSQGLYEMYDFYEGSKVDKYSYLLVYGFSLFKSNKVWLNLYKYSSIAVVLTLIFLLIKTFMH